MRTTDLPRGIAESGGGWSRERFVTPFDSSLKFFFIVGAASVALPGRSKERRHAIIPWSALEKARRFCPLPDRRRALSIRATRHRFAPAHRRRHWKTTGCQQHRYRRASPRD